MSLVGVAFIIRGVVVDRGVKGGRVVTDWSQLVTFLRGRLGFPTCRIITTFAPDSSDYHLERVATNGPQLASFAESLQEYPHSFSGG